MSNTFKPNLGTPSGRHRRATILQNNGDGTVQIGLDEGGLQGSRQIYTVPYPLNWAGPGGEFAGGDIIQKASVMVVQTQGGPWQIVEYLPSGNTFTNNNILSKVKNGRYVIQVKDGNNILVDPKSGISIGRDDYFAQLNPTSNIFSHNFHSEYSFTQAGLQITGPIKRDLVENANRNILGSALDSHAYDHSLSYIGMDPKSSVSSRTIGANIRNPALVESRQIIQEFSSLFNFTTDVAEETLYTDPQNTTPRIRSSRRENRTDAFSLSLEHPNHLIEIVQGTAVDTFGNILDINKSVLPIGSVDALSLNNNSDKAIAFSGIRQQLRKSIAYSFEINARKGGSEIRSNNPPDVNSNKDYGRDRSRFAFAVDKEGQFKLNIPASSEIGNIPLLTRTENFSVLQAKKDGETNPNSFLKSSTGQDIFLDNFSARAGIDLTSGNKDLKSFAAPIDRITDKPIKYGTAYHDITKTVNEFQKSSNYLKSGLDLINFYKNVPLNTTYVPFPYIVSNEIIVSGPDANAGGRSGSINLDGFLQVNIGANTIDRQSIHFDYAGGVVGNIGRDKQGISYAATLDGDLMLQVGGSGIGNEYDSRFEDENDAVRNGTVDIRVVINNQLFIFRIGSTPDGAAGIDIISPGYINIVSENDLVIKSRGSLKFHAENIVFHAESTKRIVNWFPDNTI